MKENPLFTKRVSAYIGKTKYRSNIYLRGIIAIWPFSKLELFRSYMVIQILWKRFTIRYTDIDGIEKSFFRINIYHHNPKIDKYIYLSGIGNGSLLYKKIKEISHKNKLKLKFLD